MQRDEISENELRIRVSQYVQEICVVLAFLKCASKDQEDSSQVEEIENE